MPDEQDENTGLRMVVHRVADFKSVYANNIQYGSTFLDIGFLFGQIEDVDENRIVHIWHSVKVTMSPQEAKIFQIIVNEAISNYESRYGAIPTLERPDKPGIPVTGL